MSGCHEASPGGPTAATGPWPYPARTVNQVDADQRRALQRVWARIAASVDSHRIKETC